MSEDGTIFELVGSDNPDDNVDYDHKKEFTYTFIDKDKIKRSCQLSSISEIQTFKQKFA